MSTAFTSVLSVSSWLGGGAGEKNKKKHKNEEWERICHLSQYELVVFSAEEQEFLQKAKDNWNFTWDLIMMKEGWKAQQGKSLEDGMVSTQHFTKFGKLFKLEGYVDASPQTVFETTVIKCDEQPKWNPTVLGSKLLQVINDNTDISYQIAAEGAGGLVASRDFVSLRHWATKDGVILSSGSAVQHPDAPPTKNYVRGENKAGGWSFFPVAGNPNKCLFIWILGTDLKGWVPQYAVDTALAGTLRDFLRHLQTHMKALSTD